MDYIKEIRKYIGHKTLLYPCATALIINKNNEVLLEKRSDDNKYGYIGGMIEVDENIIDALKREIKEETNLDVISYSFFNIYSGIEFHHIYPNDDEISPIDIVFIVTSLNNDFNIARLERLVLLALNSKAKIAFILTKSDLCTEKEKEKYKNIIQERFNVEK